VYCPHTNNQVCKLSEQADSTPHTTAAAILPQDEAEVEVAEKPKKKDKTKKKNKDKAQEVENVVEDSYETEFASTIIDNSVQEDEQTDNERSNSEGESLFGYGIAQSDNSKKNQSALRVIDRLQAKLNGIDGGSGLDSLSVEGQVSWLIREATDFRNLSKLF